MKVIFFMWFARRLRPIFRVTFQTSILTIRNSIRLHVHSMQSPQIAIQADVLKIENGKISSEL